MEGRGPAPRRRRARMATERGSAEGRRPRSQELLERAPLLAELESILAAVQDGGGRVGLIHGEAGAGTTPLVRRFLAGRERELRLLAGGCEALFTPRPLGPLFDLLPELPDDLRARLAGGAPRAELFAALLAELARPELTVLVLEDVH